MYCQICDCEYSGWKHRCPVCKTMLQDQLPDPDIHTTEVISYDRLVERVRREGGRLEIELDATQVRKKKRLNFPYRGFGFAWTSRLVGESDGIFVTLHTTQVEEDRTWSFPYFGYGYAWEQEMEGQLQGQPLMLRASKVKRERRQRFPYRGYGYAWTEELRGDCGPQLEVVFKPGKVRRSRDYQFPYFGFGYAWIAGGALSLRLLEA